VLNVFNYTSISVTSARHQLHFTFTHCDLIRFLTFIVHYSVTLYRLSLLIDISISDVVTAACLFLLKYNQYYQQGTRLFDSAAEITSDSR